MFENNRDEINYHKFLKSVRKSQGVSLEKTAFGVCTKSGMSRIESGNRLPNKLVRDRLTARLGISGEEYEEYLLPKEYEQWKLRMDIIRSINKKDIEDAKANIEKYEGKYIENSVEKQFIEAMKYMLYELENYSKDVLCTQIYKAMICTIPDMDAAFAGIQLLADQELNLIMEYVRLYMPHMSKKAAAEWKLEKYKEINVYLENSGLDKIAQAKVYTRLACIVAELVLEEDLEETALDYALELCNKAIEVLRDTVRLYYFVELNEYRVKLVQRIDNNITDKYKRKVLKELRKTSIEWANLFHELYTENDLPVYMENFTYLYMETECNNVREVIYTRRAMFGWTRKKLSANACDERTLTRIELGDTDPTMVVVRDLFEKLGICAEYKRARIVTSDAKVMQKYFEVIYTINKGNYMAALEMHEELYKVVDMDVIFNEQEMKRVEALILRGLGRLTKNEHYETLIDVLECTLGICDFTNKEEKFLSANELLCVHNFINYTEGGFLNEFEKYTRSICDKLLGLEELELSMVSRYEMFMYQTANHIGNEGDYLKSEVVGRKLLKESLRHRRLLYVNNCLYNELWNYQMQMKLNDLPIDKKYVAESLRKELILSIISKKEDWVEFLEKKLKNL